MICPICPECESINIHDIECYECDASGTDEDGDICDHCGGNGIIESSFECGNCLMVFEE